MYELYYINLRQYFGEAFWRVLKRPSLDRLEFNIIDTFYPFEFDPERPDVEALPIRSMHWIQASLALDHGNGEVFRISRGHLKLKLAVLVDRGVLERIGGKYRVRFEILEAARSLLPTVEQEAISRRRAREKKIDRSWCAIAERQEWKCWGCGEQLPQKPVFGTDGRTGHRRQLPPFTYRLEVGDVIACGTCGHMLNRGAQQFRIRRYQKVIELNSIIPSPS